MTPSDEESRSSYYLSCLQYVGGATPSIPSPVRTQFRRQEQSSSSLSSSGRSDFLGRGTRGRRYEELASRLVALEKEVYMNRQRTEPMNQNVDMDNFWDNINFDEPANFGNTFTLSDDGLGNQVPFYEEKVGDCVRL